MPVNILLSGATGRMGREIERLAAADSSLTIAGRASRGDFFEAAPADAVIIDFSGLELCARSLEFARAHQIPMVIGTTGLDAAVERGIEAAAAVIPICQAANFSIGINLLLGLVAQAATALPSGFEIEIAELHHRYKVDAPSGTALALGRAAAAARGLDHEAVARVRGSGERGAGEIGYQVARGGDVAGEHTVLLLGDGERLELIHRATDRAIFARGALHASRWLAAQPAGRYGMGDVLAGNS